MLGAISKYPITMKILLTELQYIQNIKYSVTNRNIFSTTSIVRTFLTKCTRLSGGLTQTAKYLKPSGFLQNSLVQRQTSQLFRNINTNVQNNVILYKNDHERYFRNIKIFGIGQLFGWSILAMYTYTPSFFDIFYTDNLKDYLSKYIVKLSVFSISIFIGLGIAVIIYFLCSRSVKYIILNKGGKNVTFITYHPRKNKSNITLPIQMVRCTQHRTDTGMCIPFKLKNKFSYYLVEKRGTFINSILFDYTVGSVQ